MTTIAVTEETADDLHDLKERGDTYEDVIRRLLDLRQAPTNDNTDESAASSPSRTANGLELPGTGDILERREDAVSTIYEQILSRGRVTKSELLEQIDADALGYQDRESTWKNLIQPALHELDGVEATGSSGAWIPTDQSTFSDM